MAAAAVAACGGFTSCKSDTQPRLEKPTEFVLNTPPMANQTYVLTDGEDGGVADGATSIQLTVSQPNYGLGVVTQYEVQVSLTNTWEDAVVDNDGNEITPATYESLMTVDSQAQINVSAFEMSVAVNTLNGLVDVDQAEEFEQNYAGKPQDVYVRVVAYIPHAEYSRKPSNVIKLSVIPYFVVAVPGEIWLIGAYSGWNIENGYLASAADALCTGPVVLTEPENAIGSKVYSATIKCSASGPGAFRFYTALGDWENNGVGSQVDDASVNVAIDEDNLTYDGDAVAGKGNWNLSNWADVAPNGGDLKMTVDLSGSNYKVYFTVVPE